MSEERSRAAALVAGAGLAAAAAVALGERRWRLATARRVRQLDDGAREPGGGRIATFSADQLDGLPAPVARYLALALPDGQTPIARARVRWEGLMRMRPGGRWSRFTARQHFTARPPGFVWDARVWMAPPMAVSVRDSYVAGEGATRASVAGLVPVVDAAGGREMAASSLVRWLGESVWFPTALLPGGRVAWEEIDARTARATVVDDGVRAVAEFDFASSGEILRMTAWRHRDVDGRQALTRFEGRYQGWARRDGVLVPTGAVVAWLLPRGRFSYWRGHATDVRYLAD